MQAAGFFPAGKPRAGSVDLSMDDDDTVVAEIAALTGLAAVLSTEPQREVWLADKPRHRGSSLAYNESVCAAPARRARRGRVAPGGA